MTIKQVICLRTDLNMRKGKMAAQTAHASMAVLLDLMRTEIVCNGTHRRREFFVPLDGAIDQWLTGQFTKIVVGVNSEEELRKIYVAAFAAELPCSLIQDAGKTEFNGVPTFTAVAVGPAASEKIDPITGHLKLL